MRKTRETAKPPSYLCSKNMRAQGVSGPGGHPRRRPACTPVDRAKSPACASVDWRRPKGATANPCIYPRTVDNLDLQRKSVAHKREGALLPWPTACTAPISKIEQNFVKLFRIFVQNSAKNRYFSTFFIEICTDFDQNFTEFRRIL